MVWRGVTEHVARGANARGREELVSSTSLAIKTGKHSGARFGVCWQSVSAEPRRPKPNRLKCRAASASQGLGRPLGFNASCFSLL